MPSWLDLNLNHDLFPLPCCSATKGDVHGPWRWSCRAAGAVVSGQRLGPMFRCPLSRGRKCRSGTDEFLLVNKIHKKQKGSGTEPTCKALPMQPMPSRNCERTYMARAMEVAGILHAINKLHVLHYSFITSLPSVKYMTFILPPTLRLALFRLETYTIARAKSQKNTIRLRLWRLEA